VGTLCVNSPNFPTEIARLQRIVRLEEDATVALPVPVLDLDRSTAPVRGGGQPR
jgi:hypothetical protein